MKGVIFAFIAFAVLGGITGVSSAQQGADPAGGTQMADQKEKTITATVDDVNAGQKKITVTGSEGNKVEYTLNNDTRIVTRAGNTITVGELKPGAKVAITYKGTKENPQVTKVEVQRGE